MARKVSSRREYRMLVVRGEGGFGWEVRYDGHAKPVRRNATWYASFCEASAWGEKALADARAEASEP